MGDDSRAQQMRLQVLKLEEESRFADVEVREARAEVANTAAQVVRVCNAFP